MVFNLIAGPMTEIETSDMLQLCTLLCSIIQWSFESTMSITEAPFNIYNFNINSLLWSLTSLRVAWQGIEKSDMLQSCALLFSITVIKIRIYTFNNEGARTFQYFNCLTSFLGHMTGNREINWWLCGPMADIMERGSKLVGSVIRGKLQKVRLNCHGAIDLIFGSHNRKSKNHGLRHCATQCLVSSCEAAEQSAQ